MIKAGFWYRFFENMLKNKVPVLKCLFLWYQIMNKEK